jgi:hypothetical protein
MSLDAGRPRRYYGTFTLSCALSQIGEQPSPFGCDLV